MDYITEALGLEIKDLRERREMSQEVLGRKAGYGSGAGVSISRIESGDTRPTTPRLAGIAGALGVTAERLENRAKMRSDQSAGAGSDSEPSTTERKVNAKDRLKNVQERTKLRTDRVEALASSFNDAHDRARGAYFRRFVDIAKEIEGAEMPKSLFDDERAGPGAKVQDTRATIAQVKAFSGKINAVFASGTGGASTAAVITGLWEDAATSATIAMLGGMTGRRIVGETRLLTSIVAAPIAILAAGGLYLAAHRRTKAQETELNAQLDVAEASLDATQNGFDLLAETLTRATATLEYIGVHAAHSLGKWEQGLGALPIAWALLTEDQRRSFRDFLVIGDCELSLESIETAHFLTTGEEDLKALETMIYEVLDNADATVRGLV